ncbi:hypothetical protein ACFU7Y_13075 [Kitasatospora sp. NPDC057542]|uniref:hypothetical protein n=1 Tax=Kitasatospora sp. NPDC057542 TaxID=3346162 RepID=UPI00368805B7
MVYDTTRVAPYCLDPWCENPDPELIPDHVCDCWILTPAERDAAEQRYRQAQTESPLPATEATERPGGATAEDD